MIRAFLIASQFLTCVPVRLADAPDERDIGRSLVFYPLVGLLLGLALSGAAWLLMDKPTLLAAALTLTLWTVLTGALHLDGLADCVDAWVGGRGDREKTLAIMKDPYSGPMGVAGIVLVLLLKFAALAALFERGEVLPLMLALWLGRAVLALLFLTTPYVRLAGLGRALATRAKRREVIFGLAATSMIVTLITPLNVLYALPAALVTFLLLRHMMLARIGGTTGDTAGALAELTECTVLISAIFFQSAVRI